MFYVEDQDDGPGAFRACLDVGLARTSTGAKVRIRSGADNCEDENRNLDTKMEVVI